MSDGELDNVEEIKSFDMPGEVLKLHENLECSRLKHTRSHLEEYLELEERRIVLMEVGDLIMIDVCVGTHTPNYSDMPLISLETLKDAVLKFSERAN
ncbi:hypothetical protein NQZ68_000153, partial [Dissostichus eleginoides]